MPRPALTYDQVRIRREEILDAAESLFREQGLDAVSFRRIAAKHGCSQATPYRYFPSKAHVVLGLRIRAYDAMGGSLAEASENEADPVERLRAIARAYVEFALAQPDTYSLLFDVGPIAEDDSDLARAKREALGVCRDALERAEASGDLKLRTDPLTAAHLFWAAAHGAVSLHLGGQLVVGRSLEEIVPTLITTLTLGLTGSGDQE
jgi:AcrR family transcriptional regulator